MTVLRLPEDDPQAFAAALRTLQEGGCIALPTDTVYGIAANAMQPAAVKRLFALKGRPRDKAIPLLLAHATEVNDLAANIPPAVWMIAERFWPGPLTLVLHRSARVSDVVAGGGETVAVRIPDHPFPRRLIEALGAPLAATSANRSGRPSPHSADDVERELDGDLDLIIDGGPASGSRPSTILDLVSTPPQILRAGPISWEDIATVLREDRFE